MHHARDRWHKKDVSLTWNARRTSYAVAQELFSSHEVDVGSRLLLRSLDLAAFPATGHAVDFGCGYGVLGLAIRDALPGWTVQLIDRDALAVEFSRWNAERLGFVDGSIGVEVGLGLDLAPSAGANLIVWNVPGKAGESVLGGLAADLGQALAADGLAALVVVNPLAGPVRDALTTYPDVAIVHDEQHAEHTVLHARRSTACSPPGDPFTRGLFDREPVPFGVDAFDYDLTPVVGLPEYDSYSFATQLVFDMLRTINQPVTSLLIMRPGQGHLPLVAIERFQPQHLTMVDRDFLALRASARAAAAVGLRPTQVEIVAAPDLAAVPVGKGFDLAILMLEDQVRNELHVARLEDLAHMMLSGGQVIIGGSSTVVSRFLSFAAKTRGWKLRDRVKRSGASAARLERTGTRP